ncbi:amidase [Kineosporia sp. A_224]|uniref:amidase n=1 Tax=Kineosporia sp. A_224 TaxID=1962180 RepID=UPI000B4B2CBC|nr:amidase [Kineosporia sp. A_224]
MSGEPTNVLAAVRTPATGPADPGVAAADDPTSPPLPSTARRPAGAFDDLLGFDLDAATIPDLQDRMAAGTLTAVDLTAAYLRRVKAVDPLTNAVLWLNPRALAEAVASDARRAAGATRGALDGIPVMVKDNIDTRDLPTTAGSRALLGLRPADDATVVKRLRRAGAVLLGKTNLSEWANFRSPRSTSGWSGVGGLTRNPYALDRNGSGSSTGSAVAVAASLAQVAVGTETDGSIVSPASLSGVVGLKPTLGLVSRSGIVPISAAQDTAGPMARHVVDAALLLAVLQGRDPEDVATQEIPRRLPAPAALDADALAGARIGVWRLAGQDVRVDRVVERAVAALRRAGAAVVDVDLDMEPVFEDESTALDSEFRRDLEAYLQATPGDHPRTIAALVAAHRADSVELRYFGQETFEAAATAKSATHRSVVAARRRATAAARAAIDGALTAHDLDAVLAPTNGPAWRTTLGAGDRFALPFSSTAAAVSGYPSVTVPAGFVERLPVGVSFVGARWSDPRLLSLAYAFEQATHHRRPPTYRTKS